MLILSISKLEADFGKLKSNKFSGMGTERYALFPYI